MANAKVLLTNVAGEDGNAYIAGTRLSELPKELRARLSDARTMDEREFWTAVLAFEEEVPPLPTIPDLAYVNQPGDASNFEPDVREERGSDPTGVPIADMTPAQLRVAASALGISPNQPTNALRARLRDAEAAGAAVADVEPDPGTPGGDDTAAAADDATPGDDTPTGIPPEAATEPADGPEAAIEGDPGTTDPPGD